jgi:hypothetical protein
MSHKIMRLVSPFALLALFASTATSLTPGPMPGKTLKQVLFAAQLLAYGAAAVGPRAGRVPGIARTFVVMHIAALVGLWRYLTGAQKVTWLLPTGQVAGQRRPTPPAGRPAVIGEPSVAPAARATSSAKEVGQLQQEKVLGDPLTQPAQGQAGPGALKIDR